MSHKIIISVQGGIVQSVRTNLPENVDVTYDVFDWDDKVDEAMDATSADDAEKAVAAEFKALCKTTREVG